MGKKIKTAPVNKPTDYLSYDLPGVDTWWVSDPTAEGILQQSATGLAHDVPQMTILDLFTAAAKKNPSRVALRSELSPDLEKGQKPAPALPLPKWKAWTYGEYYAEASAAAKSLMALGFEPFASVSLYGFNSPYWSIASMAALLAGGKSSGLYPTDSHQHVKYKVMHSNSYVVIVEGQSHMQKVLDGIDADTTVKAVVCWDFQPPQKEVKGVKTMAWAEFLLIGKDVSDVDLGARSAMVKPGHCCTVIYTSGTTGLPKGVMLSHDALVYSCGSVLKLPGCIGKTNGEERTVSYLPMSHIAGMMVDIVGPIAVTSNLFGFKGSWSTSFARKYDLKIGTLVDRLRVVKPTLFLGVPRVYEKIMEKLKEVGATVKGMKKVMARFAKKRAGVYQESRQLGNSPKTPLGIQFANYVLNKIKQNLGMDQTNYFFSGAAPLSKECMEFFGSMGMNINEAYGLSECTGNALWSTDAHHIWGSVGFEVTGVEVKLINLDTGKEAAIAKDLFAPTEPEQGEIVIRGRNVMMGYLANPALGEAHIAEIAQKNSDSIDAKGWLHTGDKGARDEAGMYRITGRFKELIIGAGGENVAPVPIEDEVKRLCPILSNVVMIGNKRKFNVMLVTLKAKGATGEVPGGNILAPPASTVSNAKTISEALNDPAFAEMIEKAIIAVNKNPEVVPNNASVIQKFTILPRDFSVATGELTPTLKLKRNVVDEEFTPIVDKMFEVKESYVNYNLAPTPGIMVGEGSEEAEIEEAKLETNINMDDMANELEKNDSDAV